MSTHKKNIKKLVIALTKLNNETKNDNQNKPNTGNIKPNRT